MATKQNTLALARDVLQGDPVHVERRRVVVPLRIPVLAHAGPPGIEVDTLERRRENDDGGSAPVERAPMRGER